MVENELNLSEPERLELREKRLSKLDEEHKKFMELFNNQDWEGIKAFEKTRQ